MKQTQASLWAETPAPDHDVLEGVELASPTSASTNRTDAAKEQRDKFRENDLSDLAAYLVR